MINYLRHNEIDHEQWDDCIKDSPRVKPYGFSWYLDIMAPGWEALTDDEYDAVFPLPGFRKYGIPQHLFSSSSSGHIHLIFRFREH
jgi:hypothetical protein